MTDQNPTCSYKDCGTGSPVFRPENGPPYFCIFHSPRVELKGDDFKDEWDIFLRRRTTEGEAGQLGATHNRISCSGFIFPEEIYFFGCFFIGSVVDFKGAEFHGEANFIGVKFECQALFEGTKFKKKASFNGSLFRGRSSFKDAEFGNSQEGLCNVNASFKSCIFENKAEFLNTQFHCDADFEGVVFEHKAWFDDADFWKKAKFQSATFEGRTGFIKSRFHGNVSFKRVVFLAEATFEACKFEKKASFVRASLDGANLDFIGSEGAERDEDRIFTETEEVSFRQINFNKARRIRFFHADLSRASFLHSQIEDTLFINVWWNKKNAFELYDERSALRTNLQEEVKHLYQQLVVNCDQRRDFETANAFYVREMEMRRSRKGRASLEEVYKLTSEYGQRWFKPLRLGLWIVILFSLMIASSQAFQTVSVDSGWDILTKMILPAFCLNIASLFGIQRLDNLGLSPIALFGLSIQRILIFYFISMFLLALRRRFRR